MKISTKGIYALEIVTDLALHTREGGLVSLGDVADRRKLSQKYLERIVKALKDGGIVESSRGARGGYRLTRAPLDITVKDVLNAVEGSLAPVECLTDRAGCGIGCDACLTRNTWRQIWERILGVAETVRISDIIAEMEKEETGKEGIDSQAKS